MVGVKVCLLAALRWLTADSSRVQPTVSLEKQTLQHSAEEVVMENEFIWIELSFNLST